MRDRRSVEDYGRCDYWYCSECTAGPDEDIRSTLSAIEAMDDAESKWLVQLLWPNDSSWKSAKITSLKVDDGELDIVYLENEMEDTLDLNGNVTFRFVTNRRENGYGDVMVCYWSNSLHFNLNSVHFDSATSHRLRFSTKSGQTLSRSH